MTVRASWLARLIVESESHDSQGLPDRHLDDSIRSMSEHTAMGVALLRTYPPPRALTMSTSGWILQSHP